MKNAILKIIVSLMVFAATLTVSGYLMNRGNVNTTRDMELPTLPVVYMNVGGNTVNELYGYTQDMDVALLRDSITPLDDNRGAVFRVIKYGRAIYGVNVKLRTVEGDRLIEDIDITDYTEDDYGLTASVNFKGLIDTYKEYCMEIYLDIGTGTKVLYHTRVVDAPLYCAREKLAFVLDFHKKQGSLETNGELREYMECNYQGDNTTLAYVNIHSSMEQLAFAGLNVTEVTEPVATFKELATETAVFTVNYVAAVTEGSFERRYFVEEYYRIKYTTDVTYLLDYERTMHQITNEDEPEFTSKTLTLGITDYDLGLVESEDGNIFAFVNEGKLFSYNLTTGEFTGLFSFYDSDHFDERSIHRDYDIKVLRVDEAGNAWFLVYGYMNRGTYEGKVGIALYEYDGVNKVIDEQMFISSNKSSEIVRKDIEELAYLNKNGIFYFMLDRSIYSYDIEAGQIGEIVTDLEENMYGVSASGSELVWQIGEDVNSSESLMVMNLNTGQITPIEAPEGEYIKPLAFINEDFVYGLCVKKDVLIDNAGRVTFPMYTLKIRNQYGEMLKTYEEPGIYVTKVEIRGSLLAITRVTRHAGDILQYDAYDNDYMTNNQEKESLQNVVQTAVDDRYETIVRIKFNYEADEKTVYIDPKEVIYEGNKELYLGGTFSQKSHYYVYFKGKLQRISTIEADAINFASENYGTVLDDQGYYIWYRANMAVRNQIMDLSFDKAETEDQSLYYCIDKALEYEGVVRNSKYLLGKGETVLSIYEEALEDHEILDLTGAKMENVLYYVNRDIPVLVLFGNDEAKLLIGFNSLSVVLMDPEKGTYKMGRNEAEKLFEENGNQFITYVPNF